jgi:hypothetical protein
MAVDYQLTVKQTTALNHLESDENCSVLYGGAKGGGKSYLLCVWVFMWAYHLIELFGINKIDYPLPIGFIGRKQGVDFSKTTFESWKRIVPSQSYEIREQDHEIIIANKVKIFFGGLDNQEVVNKFNSAEFAFFAIDQAEETGRGDLAVLQGSLRLTHNGKKPPYKKFYSANPAECWLKDDFITNPKAKHYYVPALPSDNPHLPDDYNQTLIDAFGFDPVLLAAYKDGDWDALQPRQALITQTALGMLPHQPQDNFFKRKIVACDPSLGGDECVVYFIEDYEIKDTKYINSNDTHVIGNDCCIFMTKHTCTDFVVDAIGIGKGVADYVRSAGKKVQEIISSAKAKDEYHFSNVRSEMWAYVAKRINEKSVVYPQDEKLRQQLCAVKYKVGSKKFELEPKTLTKQALGCSPDRADCYVYGLWGMSQIELHVLQVSKGIEIAKGTNYNPLEVKQHESREVGSFN